MKNSSSYERRFKTLLARLRKAYSLPPTNLPTDPTQELLWSILLEDSSEGTAKVAMSRLTAHFVDLNELRVSRADEIVEALPNTLPDARGRAGRIIRALQAAFDKFDVLSIEPLREQGKREARQFLASVPEMTPFVEGRVCILSLGIHAMPVDRTLVELLIAQDAVHPETDPRDTQGFLERIVPAKDALEVARLLEMFRLNPAPIAGAGKAAKKAKTAAAPTATAPARSTKPRPAASRKAPAAKATRKKK